MFKLLIFLIFLLSISTAFAQDKMETDRPDQTETPVLIPKKYFQAELGFSREMNKDDQYRLSHPSALFKYGLSKRVELRLISEYITESRLLIPNGTQWSTGFLPIEVGSKIALIEEKGIIPKISFISHVSLPFLSSDQFRTPHLAPSFRFTSQHTISPTVGVGYNVGAEWDGFSVDPDYLYTLATGFTLSEKWYTYIEAYGYLGKHHYRDHNIDAGFAYSINNDMKIDFSGGLGLSEASIKNYVALGFSFRIPAWGKHHNVHD